MYTPGLSVLGVIYYIVIAIGILSLLVFFVGVIIPAFRDLDDDYE